jgi:hypothetical protein
MNIKNEKKFDLMDLQVEERKRLWPILPVSVLRYTYR